MADSSNPFIGKGIYGISDAARLTSVHPQRIRRWLRGYRYSYQGENRQANPVWEGQLPLVDDTLALGFLDLMEVRFVHAFIEAGVSLRNIRRAAEHAKSFLDSDHPFCTHQFLTDGRDIFLEVQEQTGDPDLLNVVKKQYGFRQIIRPYLQGLEYVHDDLVRWWPLGKKRRVVIDPTRQFGQPVTSEQSVPTSLVAKAAKREGIQAAMTWYRLSRREVNDALAFEKNIAA